MYIVHIFMICLSRLDAIKWPSLARFSRGFRLIRPGSSHQNVGRFFSSARLSSQRGPFFLAALHFGPEVRRIRLPRRVARRRAGLGIASPPWEAILYMDRLAVQMHRSENFHALGLARRLARHALKPRRSLKWR